MVGCRHDCRLPGAKAHARDRLALPAGRRQRQGAAVAGDRMAAVVDAPHQHLEALERAVDVARRAAGGVLLAHHVPGLERLAQLEREVAAFDRAADRKAELEVRQEPGVLEGEAGRAQIGQHVQEIGPHQVRQHETVVQRGAPADQPGAIGLLPEPGDQRAQEQLLGEAHAGVRRHLEGAELDQAEPAGRAVGVVQLVDADLGAMGVAADVDQKVAEQAIDQPGRRGLVGRRRQRQRDLELVQAVVARLVDARRLAGRADEQAREQEREGRVVLPVGQEARKQIGPAQERAVLRRWGRRPRCGCRRRCRCGARPA